MRKESIGRLLLSLLTAFVMVVGVFAAAVYTDSENWSGEEGQANELVAREQEERTREIGDAPISAFETQTETADAEGNTGSETGEVPLIERAEEGIWNREEPETSTIETKPADHGTRQASVDANGPYTGYEGDTITFDADIIGGNNDDYYFRWDIDYDGVEPEWEGPGSAPDYWGAKGENQFSNHYLDNHYGEVKVQAWDGVSWKTIYGDGTVWDEKAVYWLLLMWGYGNTIGMKFEITEDITVDQLGSYRYQTYYPYYFYNLRLWDADTQIVLAEVPYPYVPANSWEWFDIAPVDLDAGGNYIVSARQYGYRHGGNDNPGPTADGIVNPLAWVRGYGNSFPGIQVMTDILPFCDIHYTYAYQVPDTLQDEAECAIENRAPVPINPQPSALYGEEGTSLDFIASFYDAGLDDTWEYRWYFCDGTYTPWQSVNKWDGGAKILFCTTWDANIGAIVDEFAAEIGNFAITIDTYQFTNEAPDLDYLLNYHVVIVGTNYWPAAGVADDMGDVLADYADAGGGVVQMWSSLYNAERIRGRWTDDDYNAIVLGSLWYGWTDMGTVYDPTHPIMDGVTAFSAYYSHGTYSENIYATRLADYVGGRVLAAYSDVGDHPQATGRIAALSFWPHPQYCSGDPYRMLANAVKWASQQPDVTPKSMPIDLEGVSHIFRDDHETHVTPEDTFCARVEVKDDDHCTLIPIKQQVFFDDFSTNKGWTLQSYWEIGTLGPCGGGFNGADPTQDHTQDGANRALGTNVPCTFWHYGVNRAATSPVIDGTGITAAMLEYWKHDHTDYKNFQHWYLEVKDKDGNWVELWTGYDYPGANDQEWTFMSFGIDEYITDNPNFQIRFRYVNNAGVFTVAGSNIDDLMVWTSSHIQGLGSAETSVVIRNVFPEAVIPPELIGKIQNEHDPLTFEGIGIYDRALWEPTEGFWYKWDFDDGTSTDWIYKGKMQLLNVLFVHWIELQANSGPDIDPLVDAILQSPIVNSLDFFNLGPYVDGNQAPSLALMQQYDVIITGINWGQLNQWWIDTRTDFGDRLADFVDGGGGVVSFLMTHDLGWAGDVWALLGRYIDDDYGAFERAAAPFGTGTLGTVYYPDHPVMVGVDELTSSLLFSGDYATTVGGGGNAAGCNGLLLADWQNGNSAIGCKVLNNGAKTVHIGQAIYQPGSGMPDIALLMHNALGFALPGAINRPELDPFDHPFGDNGRYNVDLMIIDDDMWWDWTFCNPQAGEPVFVGPTGENPSDWMSHNYIPIEIYNTDPVIQPRIRAYAELDLSLRMSGEKKNTATMTLLKDGVQIGYTEVTRDPGAPDIGVIPGAIIEVTKGPDYDLVIEYIAEDGDGANPTWIFEARWPDGKIKGLKHTFNSNDPTDRIWVIEDLKAMMLGHDIIFEASAYDAGSDDLAFVWNFGDCTPHGIHLYANDDPATANDGVSDEASVLFDQMSNREPWFDYNPNDIRSPLMNPIFVTDSISHVFDENQAYYYYVMLTVLDDDVDDPYPSTELHLTSGCDLTYLEIDFS